MYNVLKDQGGKNMNALKCRGGIAGKVAVAAYIVPASGTETTQTVPASQGGAGLF
jgi:hypothetical protein